MFLSDLMAYISMLFNHRKCIIVLMTVVRESQPGYTFGFLIYIVAYSLISN